MASIGHELWHAIELLREPKVRDYHAAFSFFEREGPTDRDKGRFETSAALQTGLEVHAKCALGKRNSICRRTTRQDAENLRNSHPGPDPMPK